MITHPCPQCGVTTWQPSMCQFCSRTPTVPLAPDTDALEAKQAHHEYLRAIEAFRTLEGRLEMARRDDLAIEVRNLRLRFIYHA